MSSDSAVSAVLEVVMIVLIIEKYRGDGRVLIIVLLRITA